MNQEKIAGKVYALDINILSHIRMYCDEELRHKLDQKLINKINALKNEIQDNQDTIKVTLTVAQIEKRYDPTENNIEEIISEFEGFHDCVKLVFGENSIAEDRSYYRKSFPNYVQESSQYVFNSNENMNNHIELINFFHVNRDNIKQDRKKFSLDIINKSKQLGMDVNNITSLICISAIYGCLYAHKIVKNKGFKPHNALGDILVFPRLCKLNFWSHILGNKDVIFVTNDNGFHNMLNNLNMISLMPGNKYRANWEVILPDLYSKNMKEEREEIFRELEIDESN